MSANAVKAGDAYIQVSVDGLADIKAEMSNIRSEIAAGFDKSTKLQAVSALADGFRMIGGAIGFATGKMMWFSANVLQAVERVSELQKIADRLGTSLTFISRIKIAAITSNMSMNELEQAFAAFQRNMETFSQGVGESKATFEGLGITPEMLKGWGNLENQMLNIIMRLGQIEDPSQRAGAAMRIFGEQGRKLIPLVNANADALKALMAQSDFLGLTLDEGAGRSLDRVRDNIRLLLEQVNGLWNQIAVALGPELEQLTENMIVAIKTFADAAVNSGALKDAFDFVSDSIKPLMQMLFSLRIKMLEIQGGFLDLAEMWMNMPFNKIFGFFLEEYLGAQITEMNAQIYTWNKEIRASLGDLYIAREGLSETFERNKRNWQELVKAATPAANALRDGARDMHKAAQELAKTFSGDVLGRTAEDMKKAREISEMTMKSIDNGIKQLNGQMRQAPVVRGFLS